MKGATSIQERLWELRKDKGLNLEELSELTGISKSALGNYEKEDYKEINHGKMCIRDRQSYPHKAALPFCPEPQSVPRPL